MDMNPQSILIADIANRQWSAPWPRRYRMTCGIAFSLVVHALLLYAFQLTSPQPEAEESEIPHTLMVWLQPPPPPPEPEPAVRQAEAPPIVTPAPRARREARSKPRVAPSPAIISVPKDVREPDAPDVFAVAPEAPAADSPRIDMDAARKTARAMANEQPSKNLKPNEWLIAKRELDRELETETKAAKAIKQAKRRDCQDGLPGGLLGPIIILFDKKDSGCKW
jgi:hypothetical protein